MPTLQGESVDSNSAIPFERRSFSVDRTAEILGCVRSTVFEEIRRGKLKAFKVGRARRVTGAAIAAYQNRVQT